PAQSPSGVHQAAAALRAPGRPVERPLQAAMNVDGARSFARSKCEKETTYRHLVSVEGVMRRLGRHFGEDEWQWALTGLFHDLDQDVTADDPERHASLAAEWLREAGVDERVINGVLAHAHPQYQTDRMAKGVV